MSFLQLRHLNRDIELSNAERRTIYQESRKLWWSRRRNFVIYVVLCAIGLTATNLGIAYFKGQAAALGRGATAAVVMGFSIAYLIVLIVVLERYCYAPLLRRIMREHGYDVCLKCGYWLRGLPDDTARCPECGAHRETVPLSRPPQTATSHDRSP
jgi:hypothetical protein